MTILQNTYNAYLTKKYEKEINEFKEVAKSALAEANSKLKNDLYHSTVLSDDKRGAAMATEDLTNLINLERLINNNPLEIENRLLNKPYLDTLMIEYQKLNILIVEGETVQFNENKYKWDLSKDNDVNKVLNKHWQEAVDVLEKTAENIGFMTEKTGNQIGEVMKKLEKSLSDVPYDYYFIKINTPQSNASQFAKDIMDKIKKNKGGSF